MEFNMNILWVFVFAVLSSSEATVWKYVFGCELRLRFSSIETEINHIGFVSKTLQTGNCNSIPLNNLQKKSRHSLLYIWHFFARHLFCSHLPHLSSRHLLYSQRLHSFYFSLPFSFSVLLSTFNVFCKRGSRKFFPAIQLANAIKFNRVPKKKRKTKWTLKQ